MSTQWREHNLDVKMEIKINESPWKPQSPPQHVSETSANGANSSCMLSLDTKQLDGHHAKEIKIVGNLDLLCHEHKDSREVEFNKHEAMVPAIETPSTFNSSSL